MSLQRCIGLSGVCYITKLGCICYMLKTTHHFKKGKLKQQLLSLLILFVSYPLLSATKVAFFYNVNPPINIFNLFNTVIVQPYAHIGPALYDRKKNYKLYAYVSLGEINQDADYAKKIDKSWVLTENKVWKSLVMNANNPDWQRFFVEKIITPLVKKGFQGVFLDTADSYLLGVKTEDEKKKQEAGLIKIIQMIHQKFPNIKILINRGFDLIPSIHDIISGVVAESLYHGWDESKRQYITFSDDYNKNLIHILKNIKDKYNLPIVVISYLPENNKKKYLTLANKITSLGFIPWITNSTLTTIGVSDRIIFPRQVMVVNYDDPRNDPYGETSVGFQYLAMPIEYLGYIQYWG